ncbi:MAG: response regulator [Deltaproteobacteria bacterium]|nr:response regulator [Deltaproteobacteria bacterium]
MARILIVNDEKDIATICSFVLEPAGYKVDFAHGGLAGVEAAQHLKPDLVILDWILPDATGEDVLRKLRSSEATARIPVVLMSAIPDIELQAKKLGVQGVLPKPFDMDSLLERVSTAMANKRAVA